MVAIPKIVNNWIGDNEVAALQKKYFPKINPATGALLCRAARSQKTDVSRAVDAAKKSRTNWADLTVVRRGEILRHASHIMETRQKKLAAIVAEETGKSPKDALGETQAAIEMGYFIAGEGRRFYGKTTTSAVVNKTAMTIRQPLGIAGLIVPANTPIANIAWKAFPALLCGNAAILKSSEDSPLIALIFARILREAGLPAGVFNVIHGYGPEAGADLVNNPDVDIVSFTGSCHVGRIIAQAAGKRIARVCLELGGKNPLVICDDAELDLAVHWAVLSSFSNAGQRCASSSRIIVFDDIYDDFREKFVKRAEQLKVGPTDNDDFGPVINETQLNHMLTAIKKAIQRGARLITGGHRLADKTHRHGFYLVPTILENVSPHDRLSRTELFGPITCLYKVQNFEQALALANESPYGLTASIHTSNIHRAMLFTQKIQSGVAVVNGGTYGSEPHLPFGGLKQSGNGWREAGAEALDVYSNWKTVYLNTGT
ncbi:MAG: aldehyde dehydrogenase family protein [Elusimicrobia bacterium]|nr:aldehyde dehydrogenase family protein [Elusimicrobiota bacterium]